MTIAERPNDVAATRALVVKEALSGVLPDPRVVPSADGGLDLYYFGKETLSGGAHVRYASVSCSNDGEVVRVLVDRNTYMLDCTQVDVDSVSLAKVRAEFEEHLGASGG